MHTPPFHSYPGLAKPWKRDHLRAAQSVHQLASPKQGSCSDVYSQGCSKVAQGLISRMWLAWRVSRGTADQFYDLGDSSTQNSSRPAVSSSCNFCIPPLTPTPHKAAPGTGAVLSPLSYATTCEPEGRVCFCTRYRGTMATFLELSGLRRDLRTNLASCTRTLD